MARERILVKTKPEDQGRIVIERRPLKEVFAIIGMSALAALGVVGAGIKYADYRAGERIEEADQAAHNNIAQAVRGGDCLLDKSRLVSAEASQRFIAEANQKASQLLDDKVAKPLEGATGPLTDISKAVGTTSTTEAPTTTTLPQSPRPASQPIPENAPQPNEATSTTMSIPAQFPECATVVGSPNG